MRTSVKATLFSIALLRPLGLLADPNPAQNTRHLQARADSPDIAENEIQFRRLSEADFLATHPPPNPPPEMPRHSAGLIAVSCVRIGWPADLRIELSVRRDAYPRRRVSATVSTPMFVALFDRDCSWWSPKPKDAAYALLHEQVHFAIGEYAARVLTQEMRTDGRIVRGYGARQEDAVAALMQNLRGLASQAMRSARREHEAFDWETRRDGSTAVQHKWIRQYEERLGLKLLSGRSP